MDRILVRAAIVIITLWVVTLVAIWFYVPPPPIEYLDGDSVFPQKVRAGDKFMVTRRFVVKRQGVISINRAMQTMDCEKKCDILDLPSSALLLDQPGVMERSRAFTVPAGAQPGKWLLVFSVTYDDHLGRPVAIPIPRLELEVIP